MSVVQVEPFIRPEIDQQCINAIRTLSIDTMQATTAAVAPLVYTILKRVMKFDPGDPIWPNAIGSCFRTTPLDASMVRASPGEDTMPGFVATES